ncbi:DUF6879 family protein [Herbihabitans rhizosphaerae]
MTLAEFGAMSLAFKKSAFRFETLPHYAGESERAGLALFLSGAEKPADHNERTHETMRRLAAEGKKVQKVKVVSRPYTDYTRYALEWSIPGSVAAGWEHRILDVTDRNVDLPTFDYWLYDDSKVVVVNYDDDGVPVDAELIEGDDVERYRRWRDLALEESVPFSVFRA